MKLINLCNLYSEPKSSSLTSSIALFECPDPMVSSFVLFVVIIPASSKGKFAREFKHTSQHFRFDA